MRSTMLRSSAAIAPPLAGHVALDRVGGAFADLASIEVDPRHARLRRERNEHAPSCAREVASANAVLVPSPARRSIGLPASRRRATRAAPRRRAAASVTPGSGMNSVAWRLPSVMVPVLSSSSVCTSPAASTARPDIASTLCCTSRSMPAMPIADSSPPIVVGIRQTSSDTSTKTRLRRAGVDRERLQRHDRQQEDDRQAREQDVERDLVRRLLPLGALDQRDHAIEERVARVRGDRGP